MSNTGMEKRSFKREIYISLALFLMALAPRAIGLNVFFTIDERPWLRRSVEFLGAFLYGDYARTYRKEHPGVITMWSAISGFIAKYLIRLGQSWLGITSGVASLQEFRETIRLEPFDPSFLVAVRLPVALIVSMGVVVAYLLVKKIFGSRVALIAAILLAFDSYHIAYSRLILHDALVSTFMIVSFLSYLVYLKRRRGWLYILLSGIAGGLAFLTKFPSLILVPVLGLVSIGTYCWKGLGTDRGRIRDLSLALAVWGFVAASCFFVLWPAMWVAPVETLRKVVTGATPYFSSEMTGATPNADLFFYPAVLFFLLTPLTSLGVLASVASFTRKGNRWHRSATLALLGYVLLYGMVISLGATKVQRYLLPIFPAVDILAAIGLKEMICWIEPALRKHLSQQRSSWLAEKDHVWTFGILAIGLLQVMLVLPHHPYYFTCFNPLMGGGTQAARTLFIGWGEGLDEAARYLNQKEDARDLRIATWYNQQFAPFTIGHSASLDSWFSADYVVLYSSQIQRGKPDTKMLDYFRSLRPEHVVRLKGIDYAWIYQVPEHVPPEVLPLERLEPTPFGDSVFLLGYDLDDSRVQRGGEIRLTLYWQCLKLMEESYRIYLRLLNPVYRVWGEQSAPPLSPWGDLPTNQWEVGVMYRDERSIEFLPGTPPGVYRLGLSLYDPQRQRGLKSAEGNEMNLGVVEVPKGRPLPETLDIRYELKADFGGVARLLGYSMAGDLQPGGEIHLTLFWQALAPTDQDYTVFIHLVGKEEHVWGQGDSPPADGFYLTTEWEEGEIVRDQHSIAISPEAPAGEYQLDIGMYLVSTGERLPVVDEEGQAQGDKVSVGGVKIDG